MFTCSRGTIYLGAILKPHGYGIATGKAHDFLHPFAVPPVRDHDRLDGASSVESFSDSMNAGNFFHSGRSPELGRAGINRKRRVQPSRVAIAWAAMASPR